MEDDKLQDLFETSAQADQDFEKLRTPMTILFSDIKDSTGFAEKKGDVEYMAMINRHNRLLFPVIEAEGGIVVKTIGDSILAKFDNPLAAVKAAAGMQRALAKDRQGREEIDQIRIRIGLHHGLGLIKDNDVFGDVVNAASRIEHQAEADQVLITDALVDAATDAGFECAKMGRAELKGKNKPIEIYAVAWSEYATQQLIEQMQVRYERRFKELKKEQIEVEEELEKAREQWRAERRALNTEIEQLEESLEHAMEAARQQLSEDLQSELRFQIDALSRSRRQAEQDLSFARQKFEAERNNLKAQVAAAEAALVDAMERSNNPARLTMAVRTQVDARLSDAKQEWQLEWEGERKKLLAEIERLKRGGSLLASDEKKDAARRALLEKLGKLPAASAASGGKTAEQWEREFQDAQIQWDTLREQLNLKIRKLQTDLESAREAIRTEVLDEVRSQYEPKLDEAHRERQRLEQDIQSLTSELAIERQRLNAQIAALEATVPEAQQATRKQALAEVQSEFDLKMEETNRVRARIERKHQDLVEEYEEELREAKKQIAELQEQLKDLGVVPSRAQKTAGPVISQE